MQEANKCFLTCNYESEKNVSTFYYFKTPGLDPELSVLSKRGQLLLQKRMILLETKTITHHM